MKYNKEDAFRPDIDSAAIFNQDKLDENKEIRSWDDVFFGFFSEPLQEPRNTTMAISRFLPSFHPCNFTSMEMHVPHLFTTDDMYGDRWLLYLIDLGDENLDWTFLAIKPDRVALLEYLAGKRDLIYVYEHTPEDEFYLVRPSVSSQLLRIDPKTEFPDKAKAIPGALYNDNVFLDLNDPEWGHNATDASKVIELAKVGKFYFRGN